MAITVLLGCNRPESSRSISRHLSFCAATATEPGFDCHVVAVCDVLSAVAVRQPDVLVTDQPAGGALFTVAQVLQLSERCRVLLVCELPTLETVIEAVRRGACGFIKLSGDPALVARAVRTVHAGGSWFGHAVMYEALQSLLGAPGQAQAAVGGKLTRREEQILDLIGTGLSNKEIARSLAISDHTVKTHLHRIYVKLNRSGRYKAFLSQSQTVPEFSPSDLGWATLEKLTLSAAR